MPPIVVRTLRHEFRLHASDPSLHEALRFMEIAPELPDFSLKRVDIDIFGTIGFCTAHLPDGRLVEGSPGHLMSVLHGLIFADVRRGEPDASFVHGATVLVDGKRVLFAGNKGCGKTTLTLHLLAQGHRVEGDEHLLVRASDVVARPRTLRVKPGALTLVPEMAEAAAGAPFIENWDGTPIRALSPSVGGRPWVIRAQQLDAIVFLTSNHGGRSVIGWLPIDEAFRRLMAEAILWPINVLAAVSRLRALLAATRTGEMLLGDLTGAEWHLRRFLTS
jgi:hypothetical protein